jgi:hypothetical protein
VKRYAPAGAEVPTRVVVATLLGLLAASVPPELGAGGAGELATTALLSPRGRLDTAPRFVRWETGGRDARARIRVRDAAGVVLFERHTDEGRARSVRLLEGERRWWEGGASRTVEVDLSATDGELIALGQRVASRVDPDGGH